MQALITSVCSWAINGVASLLLTSAFLKIRIRKRSRILRVDFGFCLLGCFILLADSITLTESRFKSFKLFKSFKVDPIFDHAQKIVSRLKYCRSVSSFLLNSPVSFNLLYGGDIN